MDDQILKLLKKRYPTGVIRVNEFLLPLEDAFRLVDDAEKAGIAILGVSCWFYGGPGNQFLGEDLVSELSIDNTILSSENAVSESARITREFLKTELLDYHTLVEIWLTQNQRVSLMTMLTNDSG